MVPVNRQELDRMAPNAVHQGVVAFYNGIGLITVDDLLERLGESHRPVIILDGVEDPRNLGAIIRSVEALGGGGVVIRRNRAAALTPTAVKASAGAALILPIAESNSLERVIVRLKKSGYWIYGLESKAERTVWDMNFDTKTCLVFGSEGKGIGSLIRKRCDFLVKIPQRGKVESLNVSVSVSLVIGEWLRQHATKGA